MKSFKKYITEVSKGFVKGWVHKSGTIMDTTDFNNYHIKQVIKNPSKFGLNKKKLLDIIAKAYPDAPEDYPEELYNNIATGGVDNDVYIEEYLQKKGWCMFVIDKTHGSISGWDERSTKSAAKALDDEYLPFETRKGLKLFEVKWIKPFKPKYITNKFDWYDWLEGKKAAGKRTKIGSTMAQFREEYITEAKRIEYILWGVPPGEKDETVVLDHPGGKPITNLKAAKKYKTILEKEHGVTKVRIQTIDFSKDISNMFRQAIR